MTKEQKELLIAKFENDVKKRSRLMRLLLATDQWFGVLIWNTSQDETISSYIGRKIKRGEANWFDKSICWFLRLLESKHCQRSRGE